MGVTSGEFQEFQVLKEASAARLEVAAKRIIFRASILVFTFHWC